MTLKKALLNWRVIMLMMFIVFSLVAINPQIFGNDGVVIRSVIPNSTAANAGIENPSAKLQPLSKEVVLSINGQKLTNEIDYFNALSNLKQNQTVRLETTKQVYTFLAPESTENIGLRISDAPTSNLRKGLDLEGGIRVLLEPETAITPEDLDITIGSLKERLNVYGLSDVVVRPAKDLSGKDFIVIEIAGVTEQEVKELLAKQGKFEAKISGETVMAGGKDDITYVCRSAECSGINPSQGCSQTGEGYACSFFFSITLSPEAAERQAEATRNLATERDGTSCYLSEDIVLFLDDSEVDRLRISCDLQGRAANNIQISGSGVGRTQQEAITNTLLEMKKLQTVIITGSLPVKLDVVKLDTISPTLGKEFLNNVMLVGLLAISSVVVVVFLRYRKIKIVLPMVLILISEMILILGFASLVGWNLDLAAIAGIIIVAGTGVDHLIVITDETMRGEAVSDWKKRIKNAMFIVMGAYFTTVFGMLPLLWAGAGLLKGFALTTIAGISFGVLIARPAYAAIIEKLLE
ncbi:MAG: hypothetical protein Q8Q01_02565 [archaeon]|nr:hypothetical protein [archaeon]